MTTTTKENVRTLFLKTLQSEGGKQTQYEVDVNATLEHHVKAQYGQNCFVKQPDSEGWYMVYETMGVCDMPKGFIRLV